MHEANSLRASRPHVRMKMFRIVSGTCYHAFHTLKAVLMLLVILILVIPKVGRERAQTPHRREGPLDSEKGSDVLKVTGEMARSWRKALTSCF